MFKNHDFNLDAVKKAGARRRKAVQMQAQLDAVLSADDAFDAAYMAAQALETRRQARILRREALGFFAGAVVLLVVAVVLAAKAG